MADRQPKFGHILCFVSVVLFSVFQWSLGCHSFSIIVALLEGNGSQTHQYDNYNNQKEETIKYTLLLEINANFKNLR